MIYGEKNPKRIKKVIIIVASIGLMSRVFSNGPETWVQSQVESYQRLKKWYLMPPCLALRIIRYGSRVKCSNPPLHLSVEAIEKGAFESPSTIGEHSTH